MNNSNDPDESAVFHNLDANKMGLTPELSKSEARDVVLNLVRWADVVLESFANGQMESWGLGYEQLRAV